MWGRDIFREVPNIDGLVCLGYFWHLSQRIIYRLLYCNIVAKPVVEYNKAYIWEYFIFGLKVERVDFWGQKQLGTGPQIMCVIFFGLFIDRDTKKWVGRVLSLFSNNDTPYCTFKAIKKQFICKEAINLLLGYYRSLSITIGLQNSFHYHHRYRFICRFSPALGPGPLLV
jgi:hypothetical protein